MAFVKLFSASLLGFEAKIIEVEVNIESNGFPAFTIVGLGDKSVDEAKERVRGGIKVSDFDFPDRRITVNLAPAFLSKKGSSLDLCIALGLLFASDQMKVDPLKLSKILFIGELSLDGTLRRINGIFSIIEEAREKGFKYVVIPSENSEEASYTCEGIQVIASKCLSECVEVLTGKLQATKIARKDIISELAKSTDYSVLYEHVSGQPFAKRALEIAAAGGHSVLMMGPPGGGKTLLSKALVSILPGFSVAECREVTKIYSACGLLSSENPIVRSRVIRAPHFSISSAGLVGGGNSLRPGEVTLAHRGVLFLDEFTEVSRPVLECLRQPMEDGIVQISKAHVHTSLPTRFLLVAACNPCPCGFSGSQGGKCVCSAYQLSSYTRKLSGPILDRIDISIFVDKVAVGEIEKQGSETSEEVRKRVETARSLQKARLKSMEKITCNAELNVSEIKSICKIEKNAVEILKNAVPKLNLSMRAYYKILKVSQTIADLDNSPQITSAHILEALQYRYRP